MIFLDGVDPESGEQVTVAPFELPVRVCPPLNSTPDLEVAHLTKYRLDIGSRLGTDPYAGEPTRGPDPPDWLLRNSSNAWIGVELTQLVSDERREADAMTAALWERVQATDVGLRNLDGWTLMVWRETDGGQVLPKSNERKAVEELVEALVSCNPVELTPTPLSAPVLPPSITIPRRRLSSGYAFYALPGSSGAARTMDGSRFDVIYCHSVTLHAGRLRAELLKRISEKDVHGSDHLIITVGGPDRMGIIHPSEGRLIDLPLADGPLSIPEPAHLQLVRLHDWQSGRIHELYPRMTTIA